jgi:hypothetical protein
MSHAPVAFISHSSLDVEFCDALYDALLARGSRPIMDARDFLPGDDLVDRVFEQADQSRMRIVRGKDKKLATGTTSIRNVQVVRCC